MAVALVNTNTMGFSATSPVAVTNFTISAGSNLCAFALIAYDNSAGMSISSVKIGGVSAISAGAAAHNATGQEYAEIWYLTNPTTGSANVHLDITASGTVQDIYYNLVVFSGVNQTTPIRGGTYTTGTSLSLTVSSSTNDRTITVINGGNASLSGTNQTSDGTNTAGGYNAACDHCTTAAASVTHTWTGAIDVAIAGLSINGDSGPSSLTLYLNNPIQGGANAGLLTLSAPTASTSTTGWTVGTSAANQSSRATYNTEVPTANFTSILQPSGSPVNLGEDCFRISAQTSGIFSADTWYSAVSVLAVSSGGIQDGRARFRFWRSANADGTSATEITQGMMVGSRITELSTTIAQSSSASTLVSTTTLNNEYLFLQLGWETL